MSDQAVAEPAPATNDPLSVSIGDIYKNKLDQIQAAEEQEEAPAPKEPVKESKKTEAPKEPSKPASAMDAALEIKSEEPEPTKEADPLEEFPENAAKPNWKRAREVISTQSKLVRELEAKAAALQKQTETAPKIDDTALTAVQAELAKAKAENDQMRDLVTAVNVELTPEFRAKYVEGRNKLITEASDEVKAYGGDPIALAEALAMTKGRRRDEAIEMAMGEEITEIGKANVRNYIAQIEATDKAKAKELANPQNSFEQYQQRQAAAQEKAKAEAEEVKQATFQKIAKTLPDKSPLFKAVDPEIPGATEWNAEVARAQENGLRLLKPGQATFEETAEIALKGSRYDAVEKMLLETRAELVAVKKQLTDLDGADPHVKGRGKTKSADPLDMSPGEIYRRSLSASLADD